MAGRQEMKGRVAGRETTDVGGAKASSECYADHDLVWKGIGGI